MKKDEFPPSLLVLSTFLILSFIIIKAPFIYSTTYGPNYENVSVDTRVNITQSRPVITLVEIDEGNATITLNAGMTRSILCNVSVRDYNGWNDTISVNATFWDNNNVLMSSADDNNSHYTNNTCTQEGNDGNYLAWWSCAFDVWYYANNGSDWRCNATAIDNYNFTDSEYNTTTISALYALNLTSLIDYGNMAVGDTSLSSQTANITNFGNMNINVSLYGYGGTDFATGNGLAFICEIGNISVDNERFSLTDQAWTLMTNLTNTSTPIINFTSPQRINDSQEVINMTYWRLYVPPNPFGQCNGTVVFSAEVP